MDQLWNGNDRAPFVPRPSENSFGFLYNNNYGQFPESVGSDSVVLEMKQPIMMQETSQLHYMDHKSYSDSLLMIDTNFNAHNINDPANSKKERLSNEQLESLENSFQEDIKLDPERKQRLAKELGLQPRQIAVWFQNRRARWKGKQLERLYDALKKEYDAVSKEKHKLQKEVSALRAILKEQVMNKNQLVVSTEISNEETVEGTSIIPSGFDDDDDDDKSRPMAITINNNVSVNQIAECNYDPVLNHLEEDDYTQVMITPYNNYWAA